MSAFHRILSASPLDSEENQSRSFGADWHGERIVVLGMATSFESHEVAHIQAYPATAALMAAMVSTLFARNYSSPALPWDVANAMATANEQRHATNMKA